MEAAVSVRTCVGCGRKTGTVELRRVRQDSKPLGRGAWLCRGSLCCFDNAIRRKAFERAFRRSVDKSFLEELRREFVQDGWT